MNVPKAELELTEQPHPDLTPDGWIPIGFEKKTVAANSRILLAAAPLFDQVHGPYLIRFDDPEKLSIEGIRIGTHALEATNHPIPVENLIANVDAVLPGSRFFPIDGPACSLGNMISICVLNDANRPRAISLTVYARPKPKA